MARKPSASASAPSAKAAAAKAPKGAAKGAAKAAAAAPAKGSRAAIILAMISRKRGCSAPEVAEKFGINGGCTELSNARKRADFAIRAEQDGSSARLRYFRA